MILAAITIAPRAIAQLSNESAAGIAASLRPPSNVQAHDHPWDGGDKVDVRWSLSPDDQSRVKSYEVYWVYTASGAAQAQRKIRQEIEDLERLVQRRADDDGLKRSLRQTLQQLELVRKNEPVKAGSVDRGVDHLTVEHLEHKAEYLFQVRAVGEDRVESQPAEAPQGISPRMQLFDGTRGYLAIIAIVICGSVMSFILLARRGVPLRIRRISGLEAVDEAVGRATEMGRPVLFVPGIQDMNEMMTLAGLTALSRVAKTVAEYDAKLEVPTAKSLVMAAARETVQSAYLAAGRPDAYNENLIYYVTDEQFGYVAYLTGHMVREKPAACFYLGCFFAESLILAETGNTIGAIQIAGTAETSQLPFFVAACDYTLIGEEFYAASAYLSGEPDQLGSLRGQDVGKIVVACGMLIGCGIATLAALMPGSMYESMLSYLKGTMLQ